MEAISDLYFFLMSVIFISLSGVMMPGPVFAVTIAKGYRNKIAGALIALGHGAIEFPLMLLINFGFAQFFVSPPVQKIIGFIGGLILIYMSIHTVRAERKTNQEYRESGHGPVIAGILATSANPYFFLWWATVGTTLTINSRLFGFPGFLLFAFTHWSCDLLWNSFVSVTVFKSRHFWTRRVRKAVFGFCFVVLMGFGVWFTLSSLL